MSLFEYQLQIETAKQTLRRLYGRLLQIEASLHCDPENTCYKREMKIICLDITITENELEHAQLKLDKAAGNNLVIART